MSKFLNLVENNLPPQDLDKNREVLRSLQQIFSKAGIKSSLKTFSDVVTITVGDNTVDLQLKHIYKAAEEDEDVIASIIGMDPKKLTKNLPMAKAKKDIEAVVTTSANMAKAVMK